MVRTVKFLATLFAVLGLATVDGSALAQGKGKDKDKDKDRQEQSGKGKKDEKPQKAKEHKHRNGKDLLGEKVKTNGKHKLHENGKHTSFVNVANGKITGVSVVHAEKGAVPVKKYKTTKKMAEATAGGFQTVAFNLAQSGTQYLGQIWIGYAYYDDWGDEVIYWFPYDMIYDGDTGAVEYVPA